MTQSAEKHRFERKYRIEGIPVDAVRQVIRCLPLSLRPLYPARRVNNLYFDTPALDTFHESVSGVGQRRKFRIRWYGAGAWPDENALFEIKIRDGEMGRKSVFPLAPAREGDIRALTAQVRAFPQTPATLCPALFNSYERAYYGTARGDFHLTLDWGLQYRDYFGGSKRLAEDAAVVMEVKYSKESEADLAAQILQNLPFRLGKNSKYVQGIQSLFLSC
jgi:hypothetical protein